MRGLFRAFEREGVDTLLIGGQAAILYGAAHFTQDLDLWVRPEAGNIRALLRALGRVKARVHKLTPPLTQRWIRAGHGFHFTVPQSGRTPAYLDIMGVPPRVGGFRAAARRSRRLSTPWGTLSVVAIEDLVELKKTNRPGDYEVISRLARIRLAEPGTPTPVLIRWALDRVFRIEDLQAILSAYAGMLPPVRRGSKDPLQALLCLAREGRDASEIQLDRASRTLDEKMGRLLSSGRRYWQPRLEQLRCLRKEGALLPEGLEVRDLLKSKA